MAKDTLSPQFRQLQPELILQIFEAVGSQGDMPTALKLSHVSSWVQPVVESQIYHTVVLSTPEQIASFAYVVTKRPASFFKKHVRRLCIAPQSHMVPALPNNRNFKRMIASILATCSHVNDLCLDQACLTETTESLSCRPRFVFMVTSSMIFCSVPTVVLGNVTHLYLLNGQIHPDVAQKISQLPNLTHMAISYAMNASMAYILRTINALLPSRTLVRLLVLPWQMFANSGQSEASISLEQSRLMAELNKLRDSRVVLVPKVIGKEEQHKLWKDHGMDWNSLRTITGEHNKTQSVSVGEQYWELLSSFMTKMLIEQFLAGLRSNRCSMDERSLFVHERYRGANHV